MSQIDKLSILGVRSFDNRVAETIQFIAPLTLIVGLNGSGKTTVIECLKYITTGELPPNSARGGAFIHDPQLCGEKEVLAQVKMSFKSTTGVRMVATRSMQLTVKKTTRSQKTLEGQLLMLRDGERTSISTRVAELDQMVPQYLGVSKAILEYVIFCHQDESLWPLSEPAALKKRFDEIFEAMKYTKAIDNIKAVRKKQNEELGKLRIIEQHTKDDKDKADRDKARMNSLYDEIDVLREKAVGLNSRITEATQKSEAAWERAAQFDADINKLAGKRIEAVSYQKSVDDLKVYLVEMTDSDDALDQMLNQYQDRLATIESEVGRLQNEAAAAAAARAELRQTLHGRIGEIGRCEAEQSGHDRNLVSRRDLICELAEKHGLVGLSTGSISDQTVGQFFDQLVRLGRDNQVEVDVARRRGQDRLSAAQQALTDLAEQRHRVTVQRDSHRSTAVANEARMEDLQMQMDGIDVDVGTRARLDANLANVHARLESAKAKATAGRFDDAITAADDTLRTLDATKDGLDAEMVEATQQAGDTAKLDYLTKELRDRQVSLESMVDTHRAQLETVLALDRLDVGSVERVFQLAIDGRISAVRDAEAAVQSASTDLRELDYRLETATTEADRARAEVAGHEAAVRTVLEPGQPLEEYPDELQKSIRSVEIVRTDSSNFAEMRNWYTKCLEIAQTHGVCRLCQQTVSAGKDLNGFLSRLEKNIARSNSAELEDDMRDYKAEYERVNAVRARFDAWKRISQDELPVKDEQIASMRVQRTQLQHRLDQVDAALSRARTEKRQVEAVGKIVGTIGRYAAEVTGLESQVDGLTTKTAAAGLSRPISTIQDELRRINDQSREAKTAHQVASAERTRITAEINALELEGRDVQSKVAEARHKLSVKDGLAKQLSDLDSSTKTENRGIETCDFELAALQPRITNAQMTVDQTREEALEAERKLQQVGAVLAQSTNRFRHVNDQITAYLDRGIESQLSQARLEVGRIELEIGQLDKSEQHLLDQVKQVEDQTRSFAETKREITDNLRYRRACRQLESVQVEITVLESKNAESDKERFTKEANRWSGERNRLAAEQATVVGELKGKDNQLEELIEIWESDYKDAAFKFREAHIKVETTKAAVDDLGRYAGALDQAIMKYHSLKMEEINRIVEELWKKTYQGSDVDTIMIRSDSDVSGNTNKTVATTSTSANAAGTGVLATTNKSYNYRVVMIKADAEMDMRGRCSAGQKVLASIIIRLALAECFGVNCGLIALDEPTTNLDGENIRALAVSLHEIIRIRKQQSNFQLIVITHDEEFLRHMQCADFADSYWRISRNAMMKSVIEKQRISEVL